MRGEAGWQRAAQAAEARANAAEAEVERLKEKLELREQARAAWKQRSDEAEGDVERLNTKLESAKHKADTLIPADDRSSDFRACWESSMSIMRKALEDDDD